VELADFGVFIRDRGLHVALQQRFNIDQHQLVAVCDHVFVVTIVAAENVQNRQKPTCVAIEALEISIVITGTIVHEFHESVVPKRQDLEHAKDRLTSDVIQMLEVSVVRAVDAHVPGLVNGLPTPCGH
jgi:hypothetical protein